MLNKTTIISLAAAFLAQTTSAVSVDVTQYNSDIAAYLSSPRFRLRLRCFAARRQYEDEMASCNQDPVC